VRNIAIQVKGLVIGFHSARITVKEIASAMDVEQVFKQKQNRRTKRQFDYESTDEGTLSAEKAFRT
jgi:hypothetical protein